MPRNHPPKDADLQKVRTRITERLATLHDVQDLEFVELAASLPRDIRHPRSRRWSGLSIACAPIASRRTGEPGRGARSLDAALAGDVPRAAAERRRPSRMGSVGRLAMELHRK